MCPRLIWLTILFDHHHHYVCFFLFFGHCKNTYFWLYRSSALQEMKFFTIELPANVLFQNYLNLLNSLIETWKGEILIPTELYIFFIEEESQHCHLQEFSIGTFGFVILRKSTDMFDICSDSPALNLQPLRVWNWFWKQNI